MTRGELKSYRMWKREIEDLSAEIREGETSDAVLSSAEFPYSQHTVMVYGGVTDGERRRKIRERAERVAKCRRVEDFIQGIDDPVTREIAALKYLNGRNEPTWRDIAQRIGGNNTENSVKVRIHRLFHEKM